MTTLRPYQAEDIETLLQSLAAGEHPVCDWPTGAGKGIGIASLCQRLDGRILVVTHRKELIEQNESALLRMADEDTGVYSAGIGRREMGARVIFAGVQSIYNRMDDLQAAGPFRYVMVDECFPAGTLVDGIPIQHIKVGQEVKSYNHDSNCIEQRKVVATSARQSTILLKITLNSGTIVECTLNHPFYTGQGYTPAHELSVGDYVYTKIDDVSMSFLQERIYRSSKCCENESLPNYRKGLLWECVQTSIPIRRVNGKPCKVPREMGSTSCGIKHSHEVEEPHAFGIYQEENVSYLKKDWAQTKDSRREWERAKQAAGNVVDPSRGWMGSRIYSYYEGAPWRKVQGRHLVQNRLSLPHVKDSCRDRRDEPSQHKGERAGSKERQEIIGLRMDRITSIEQRRIEKSRGCTVFNLEVEGNNNYFANGVLVHNCHMLPPVGQPSMYSTILEACPKAQRIGFSATPYRLNDGPIWGDNACWFDSRPVHRGITELTRMGYLSPLVGVETAAEIDLSKVRSRSGDYVLSDLSQVSSEDSVVKAACDEICYLAQDRHSWLVFAVDRAHAAIVADELLSRGIATEIILGNTHKDERRERLARFKAGGFRALVNVGVLTTGYDYSGIDCVVMLRATQSKSLFIQCIGRGTRLCDGKKDCAVLDMGGNLARHMPIDGIPEVALSPRRAETKRQEQAAKRRERKARHGAWAARGIDPLADVATGSEMLLVENVKYYFKKAKKYPTRTNIVVTYQCVTPEGAPRNVQQFVLPEYPARPGLEARAWFERRGLPMPRWANQARATLPKAPIPSAIVVTKAGGWDKVTMEMFDEVSV